MYNDLNVCWLVCHDANIDLNVCWLVCHDAYIDLNVCWLVCYDAYIDLHVCWLLCLCSVQLLRKTGAEGKQTVFLFSDNQIKDESFMEDISMILNTGDVPNIFPADEKADIIDKMQIVARNAVSWNSSIFVPAWMGPYPFVNDAFS